MISLKDAMIFDLEVIKFSEVKVLLQLLSVRSIKTQMELLATLNELWSELKIHEYMEQKV